MCKTVLFRNMSSESEKVKDILEENNIPFVEIFSLTGGEKPILSLENNVYSFYGYENILVYLKSLLNSKLEIPDYVSWILMNVN